MRGIGLDGRRDQSRMATIGQLRLISDQARSDIGNNRRTRIVVNPSCCQRDFKHMVGSSQFVNKDR